MNGEEWRPQLNKNLHSRVYQPKFIARQSNFHRNLQKKPNLAAVKEEKELDWLGICLVLSFTLLIQAILAVGSYSGEGMKPLNGDFEAQRHWLEITFNLPIYQWYVNGTENDLLYWGLDYPPLTAYHSWLMGFLANKIDSSWIELHSSRGIETGPSKMFMRLTAILPFYLIYLPVVFAFTCLAKSSKISQTNLFAAFFAYGGLLVVDCAHFQYNSVSLGFFIGSYVALTSGFVRLGSILFCLAVNYKQMELYHALPIFVFILARTTKRPLFSRIPETVKGLLPIALVVLYTFAAIWSPFLLQGRDAVQAVLSRIFPFSRGLYEDKVASVWCALSPVLKLNRLLEHATLLKLCTGCVLVSSLPSLLILFARPTAKNFRLALFLTSLSFFLFSFQVHEKSILLSAIAALLLLPDFPAELAWFLHLANTSLFSLCMKDGTQLTLLYFVAYSIFCHAALPGLESKPFYLLKHVSCLGSIAICLAEWFLVPPAHLPHIFPLLNAFYSCSHFVAFLLYFYAQMFREEYQKWTKKSS